MNDLSRLLASAFLRAFAVGMIGVEAGISLAHKGFAASTIAEIISAGLAGAAVAALLATLGADRFGRRRFLVFVALVSAAGVAVASTSTSAVVVGVAAFLGMLNGMGRDRGASLVLEQAMLPAIVGERERTKALAWYNVLQDMGHALGALAAALPGTSAIYMASMGGVALLSGTLTPAVEAAPRMAGAAMASVEPRTRRLLTKISALFLVDAVGGGFLTTALLSVYFVARFDVSAATIGALFFGARVLNAVSHLGAAWLARRIGLVNTMVFTHIPSSLLLVTVAYAPSFPIAAALLLLREGLVEMDVPTRQSYVLAIVRPGERTLASGVTSLVRMAGWAAGPFLAAQLMRAFEAASGLGEVPRSGEEPVRAGSFEALAVPLVVGAALKIAYDLLLWRAFRHVKPPEEIARS